MPLEYDPRTSKISLDGREVGEYVYEDGTARVRLDLTYECTADEWIVPLSWFDYGLHQLAKYKQPKTVALQIESSEDDIAETFDVVRLLTEKLVKRDGYIWAFHKNDPDNWPSALHGHDYEKGLKLDAITGDIYDIGSRQRCRRLTPAKLALIHGDLRESKDFRKKVIEFIDRPSVRPDNSNA